MTLSLDLAADGLGCPGRLSVWRSHLTLNPEHRHRFTDVHLLHALVMSGFNREYWQARDKILYAVNRDKPYRVKTTGRMNAGRPRELLVQSPCPPDWSRALDKNDEIGGRILLNAAVNQVTQDYVEGDVVDIQVDANLVSRKTLNEGENRRYRLRYGDPSDYLERFKRTIAQGLDVPDTRIGIDPQAQLHGRHPRHGTITLVQARYYAQGRVSDPEDFRRILTNGIGHGKPYGCGLVIAKKKNEPSI